MVSIKVLNISLVLLCILTTSFVCTLLAISSSEKALDDTKESRDVSVGSCFAVGEESVTNRTTEYMDLLMDSTVDVLTQFMKEPRQLAKAVSLELEAAAWDDIKRWEWHRLPRYFHHFNLMRPDGVTGLIMILKNNMMLVPVEHFTTIANSASEYHDIRVLINHGDDHLWGGLNRSFEGTLNTSSGYAAGVTNPLTDVNWNPTPANPCVLHGVDDHSIPHDACKHWLDEPVTFPFYLLASSLGGQTLWSSPLVIDDFVTLFFFSPVYHNGVYSGYTSLGTDLRHISKFLSTLDIGGPVHSHPSRGRVFVTVRSTWMDPTQVGKLIGASHGESVKFVDGSPLPLFPNTSSDPIIRSVANQTAEMGLNLTTTSASGNLTVLSIETDLEPQGEDFFYRVGRMADIYGIDWYVHLVIDREYILGTIDRKTAETRDEIKASEEKVDDDLKQARTILYVLVVTVAAVLTVLSAVLVLKIIEPLLVLEKEMAAVAVMNLEAVNTNRPLSALQEVRLMQVSFLQMIQNLVEYRNYMPASVLQTDEDSDEATSARGGSSASRTTRTSGGSSHGASRARAVYLHDSDVRTKRVTLMVCNVVGFLQVKESHHMQGLLARYLAAGLQHLKKHKGIPDSFSGDRLYASWNGVRVCSSHRAAGYVCARELSNDNDKALGVKMSIGLASGEARCGNMGCEGMKKYSYIGGLSSWVHVVERIGRSMECDVAIDSVVNEEVSHRAYTRMLQHVEFAKHSSRILRVYQSQEQKEVAAEEWMYQLREGDSNDPNKTYNASYELFMGGKVQEAMRELGQYDDGSRVVALYRERLEAALSNSVLCEPLGRKDPLYN